MDEILNPHPILGVPMRKSLSEQKGNANLLCLLKISEIGRRVQSAIKVTRRHGNEHPLSPSADHAHSCFSAWIANCQQRADNVLA